MREISWGLFISYLCEDYDYLKSKMLPLSALFLWEAEEAC
jgi:hypothetical protein